MAFIRLFSKLILVVDVICHTVLYDPAYVALY